MACRLKRERHVCPKEDGLARNRTEKEYIRQHDRRRQNVSQTIPVKRGGKPPKGHVAWAVFVLALSFVLSIAILLASTAIFSKASAGWAFLVVIFIILVGIVFDVIGIAVTAAEETPFHSMASRKMSGARESIRLIRHASRVSSICNDVVGDICGVVSGSAGTVIVYRVFTDASDTGWVEAIAGAAIAALTVGGKAFAKNYGINNSDYIVYRVGRLLAVFPGVFPAFFQGNRKRA